MFHDNENEFTLYEVHVQTEPIFIVHEWPPVKTWRHLLNMHLWQHAVYTLAGHRWQSHSLEVTYG